MKIRKFNENVDFVDPTADIIEFKEKFPEKRYKSIEKDLFYLETEFTNQTSDYDVYRIIEYTDDRGNSHINLCYVRAVSQIHAKIKGAILRNDVEIATTGYYNAYVEKDIKSVVYNLELKVKEVERNLDNAKNPY